ncbi:MAG TPA: efflux RND transporter periplasmic adaptor subunit [Terracidiphilus sp.]|nr:efflux RND transporter periplasmic adaptor subunit [Terracidiphilus sp.]
MKTRHYQFVLAAAIAVCIALGGALGYTLLHRGPSAPAAISADDPVVASGPAATSPSPHAGAAPAAAAAPLAPIQLSPQRLQEIGVTTAIVAYKNVNNELNVPGNVDIDEEKLAYVQTRFPGWIQDVYANATYQYVRKGQTLFTIYSPDLVSSEQEYLLARQNQKTFSPETHPASTSSMAAQESGWLLNAAEERIRQFGVPQQVLSDLERTANVQRNIAIDSPVSGFITERNALPNAYVQPDTKLYTIADLSTVWVYANVFQDAVGRLRPGDPAQVTVDAYPGRTFRGRIDQILPQVDPATRTVRVRLVFSNPGVALKPGMYVNVAIHAPLGRQLVIPASAVLESGQQAIAFVDHGQGYLEPRIIQAGPQIDDSILILSGLKAGEKVVSSANFLLDSEAQLQSALGGFAPPPPSSTSAAPAAQLQIDLTTQPEPPRKGANTVRVKLTGADGKPVTGVQVAVTFFMPAMPAMGMAAERASTNLAEQGGGLYGGPLELPSGGTFQATVTVQRAGQTLATRQLSIDVTGGM